MKKTVLYFFDYGISFGGAVNTLLQQMLLMKERGYAVYGFISCYLEKPPSEDYLCIFRDSGIELESINYPICSHTEDIDIVRVLECYEKVKQVIQKYEPVLLHSVQINPTVELVSRELKIPHIMDVYQANPEFFAIPYINLFPQYHICDSLCYAKAWQDGLGIQSFCVRTVAKCYKSKKESRSREKLKFICVGQISSRKNQLEVIKGFHNALQRGVKGTLELYGSAHGFFAEECRQYITENELEGEIQICGFCPNKEEIYTNADILICGSKIESYPNVISEALANGILVVSTPVAGVPEVIKNGVNGYLCGGYLAENIADGILEAAEAIRSGKAKDILQNAEKTFLHTHAEEQVAKELDKVYQEVIRAGVPSGLPDIGKIQNVFSEITDNYYKYEKNLLKPEFVRKKLWYLFYINPIIKKQIQKGKQIYIWGAGKIGTCILEVSDSLKLGWKFAGFLDRGKAGTYLGLPINKPEEIYSDKNNIILIAFLSGTDEAMQELKEAKRTYGEDYFLLAPRNW